MNALELRKRLLIGECEVHRTQLAHEWHTLTRGARALYGHAKSVSAFATIGAALVTGFSLIRRRVRPKLSRPWWWQALMSGVRLGLPVWAAWKQRSR